MGSSRVLKLVEQEIQKERRNRDGQETQDDLDATSSRGEKMASYMPKGWYHSNRDHELENL